MEPPLRPMLTFHQVLVLRLHACVHSATITLTRRLVILSLWHNAVISTGDGTQSGRTGTSEPVAMAFSIRNSGRLAMPRPARAASTRMVWRFAEKPILGRTIARDP